MHVHWACTKHRFPIKVEKGARVHPRNLSACRRDKVGPRKSILRRPREFSFDKIIDVFIEYAIVLVLVTEI
jgi:hypothetical protein